ncbi:MAG TPA: hypothetical protein PL155_06910 [Candidatus Omnitrophota bacterium]|nr:hypothetical protein [Candidatus Omnitrophota bacterium]HPD85561.1 hypothetical protein [Candidatus Omnitrophota bacterium]HRZ04399.1 hypothetical protein [Candidatus Omnitrophota bacterium]
MSEERDRMVRKIFIGAGIAVCLFGIWLRFYRITANNFFLYDEGLYLDLHRQYLELITKYPPKDFHNFMGALGLCFRLALGEGKALWFFISHVRVFWGGLEDWYFPRLVSAMAGTLTIPLVFLFARRFFNPDFAQPRFLQGRQNPPAGPLRPDVKKLSSGLAGLTPPKAAEGRFYPVDDGIKSGFNSSRAALLSAALLAILPSHVLYSRLALQEGFCTFIFIIGFYFYLFPPRFGYRTFLSSFFLAMAFFSNYRLIIIPVFVFFAEFLLSLAEKRMPNFRKYLWHTLIFLLLVFAIGGLDRGQNTVNTFAWMYRQTQLAEKQLELFNFLSYPYYIFRFEGLLFGLLFFGNIYLLFKREWKRLFPFLMVCFTMGVFSLTADKGARYLCIMLPFMVLAVVSLIDYLLEEYRNARFKVVLSIWGCVMAAFCVVQSLAIAQSESDYESSVKYLKQADKNFQACSTQWRIQGLFADSKKVVECPKDFRVLLVLYADGVRYLVVDPQAFVSYTADEIKFKKPLIEYLDFIEKHIRPVKVFPHFNRTMLERFVFEHNDNLIQSLRFLNRSDRDRLGELKIYDLKTVIGTINRGLAARNAARKR